MHLVSHAVNCPLLVAPPARCFAPLTAIPRGSCRPVVWSSPNKKCGGSCRIPRPCLASSSNEVSSHVSEENDVKPVLLAANPDSAQLERECAWLSEQITTWLDEEWQPQAEHIGLGAAAGLAYVNQRQAGESDIGSILLGVAQELQAFNYRETFTGAFEVANKVAELLMVNEGCDVCCRSPEDVERTERLGLVPDS